MTLDIRKIREMWWLFGFILPIQTDQHKEAIKLALGHGLDEIIPDLMVVISQYAERNPEEFEMYCEFIVEALDYMRNKRKKWQPNQIAGAMQTSKRLSICRRFQVHHFDRAAARLEFQRHT